MQPLDLFLPYLQPWLSAVPEPLARSALLRAAREFCERTSICEVTAGPLNAAAGQADFPFTVPADLEVVRLKRAWWGTTELLQVTPEEVDSPLAYTPTAGGQSRSSGAPNAIWLSAPLTATVSPLPDKALTGALTLRLIVRPSLSATTVPDELLNTWMEGVVAKAALTIAGMPGGTMVSMEMLASAQSTYMTQVARAADMARRGPHRVSMRVQGNPFA